jgi:glycosyltransferase involved in cell wall biosynthesis
LDNTVIYLFQIIHNVLIHNSIFKCALHIAFLIPAYLPARDYGGPLSHIILLGKQLIKKNHKVTIYTTNAKSINHFDNNLDSIEIIDNITVKRFPVKLGLKGYWISPSLYSALAKDDFDIMHSHCMRCFQSDIAYFIAKKLKKPLIISPYGSLGTVPFSELSFSQIVLYKFHNFMDKKICAIASNILAANELEQNKLLEYGVSKNKLITLPLGIDVSEFNNTSNFRNRFNIEKNTLIILFVGRFNKIKGLDVLLDAYSVFVNNNQNHNTKLVIIGQDDGYYTELLSRVNNHVDKNNILLLKNQKRETIVSAFNSSDIFVLSSYFDTGPITILESLASSTAVIASNVGGIPEVIQDEQNGLLFPSGNFKDLAKKIQILVNDNSKRKKLIENGKITIQNRTMESFTSQILDIYSNVIKK